MIQQRGENNRQGAQQQQEQSKPAQQTVAEDLFPEHKKDDQFEIPAFLRRQSN